MQIHTYCKFSAIWNTKDAEGISEYDVEITLEGPDRKLMTDVDILIIETEKLQNTRLKDVIGASSIESIAMYLKEHFEKIVDPKDKLIELKVTEISGYYRTTVVIKGS